MFLFEATRATLIHFVYHFKGIRDHIKDSTTYVKDAIKENNESLAAAKKKQPLNQ